MNLLDLCLKKNKNKNKIMGTDIQENPNPNDFFKKEQDIPNVFGGINLWAFFYIILLVLSKWKIKADEWQN